MEWKVTAVFQAKILENVLFLLCLTLQISGLHIVLSEEVKRQTYLNLKLLRFFNEIISLLGHLIL